MRLPRFWRRDRRDRELQLELDAYLEHEVDRGIAAGMSPDEARAAAARRLGNTTRVREDVRDLYSLGFVEHFARGLGRGMRALRGSPGFALAALLSLALGIGANTAVFELLNALRLRPLPIPRPSELAEVVVDGGTRGFGITNGDFASITAPLWDELSRRQQAFSGIFAWGTAALEIGRAGTSHRVRGLWVSGSMFDVLELRPQRGRLLGPADDRRGCAAGPVVVSDAFWRRELGAQDDAIGRTIVLDDHPFEVVGVTPPGFFGFQVGNSFDVALPVCAAAIWNPGILDQRNAWWLVVMGRLKPGWSLERAAAHFDAMSAGLFAATLPAGYDASTLKGWKALRLTAEGAARGLSSWREQYESSLWLLLGVTGLVLLLTCANLANLLLARASAREREFALRVAIGASRSRLMSQCLAESLLLAGGGAVLGGSLAQAASGLLVGFVSTEANPLLLDVTTDARVLSFTAIVAGATCLACGVVPAWRAAHADPQDALKSGGRSLTVDPSRSWLLRGLVVVQVAVSLVLVVGAVLFVRSLQNLLTLDAGFRQEETVFSILSLSSGDGHEPDAARVQAARERVLAGIRALPDVQAAATSTHLPLSGMSWGFAVRAPAGRGEVGGSSRFAWVSDGYFHAMGIRLRAGRDIDSRDVQASRRVAVVNEAFARQFLPGRRDPIGATFRSLAEPGYPDTVYEVVGLVADTKYGGLREAAPPIVYAPVSQHPSGERWPWTLVAMRTSAPIAVLKPAMERAVAAAGIRSDVVVWPLARQIREGLLRERLMSWLSSFFAGLALLLAALGIYGVVAYGVSRRGPEIAIRMALGASAQDVRRLMLRQTAAVIAVGLAAGALGALAAGRAASALLFGLTPYDPITLVAGAVVLALVGLAAAWVPAARASRISPLEGLRAE